jgi:biotin-dependent carboxylase-like uncharacterized protein
MIEILEVGLQATVQDLGRSGLGHLGVPEAGAADPFSLRLANRLVGNDENAAGIEALMGGLAFRLGADRQISLTGAPCLAYLDERPIGTNASSYARKGQILRLHRPMFGLRTYVAFDGGIDVTPVLGSRSTDTLSGLGPARGGTVLSLGVPESSGVTGADVVVCPTVAAATSIEVAARLGPRDDLFSSDAIRSLTSGPWQVSQETDRIAARLIGPPLPTTSTGQLPTEGLALGSIQVPPSGQPIVHLANHPPTGGYPVLAVVDSMDVSRIAQSPPGTNLRFVLLQRILIT